MNQSEASNTKLRWYLVLRDVYKLRGIGSRSTFSCVQLVCKLKANLSNEDNLTNIELHSNDHRVKQQKQGTRFPSQTHSNQGHCSSAMLWTKPNDSLNLQQVDFMQNISSNSPPMLNERKSGKPSSDTSNERYPAHAHFVLITWKLCCKTSLLCRDRSILYLLR